MTSIPIEYRLSTWKRNWEEDREFYIIYSFFLLLLLLFLLLMALWVVEIPPEDEALKALVRFDAGGVPLGGEFIPGGEAGGPGTSVGKPGAGQGSGVKAAGGGGGAMGLVGAIGSRTGTGSAVGRLFGKGGLGAGLEGALGNVQGTGPGGVGGGGGIGSARFRGYGAGEHGDGIGIGGVGKGQLGTGYGGGTGSVDLGVKTSRVVSARITQGKTTVKGHLDPALIEAVVRENLPGLRYCYEKELNRDPKLQGTVVTQFTIDLEGLISRAVIESTSMKDAVVEDCMIRRIKRWRFPKPQGGDVIVSYPFMFSANR